jgi:[ribosomal protein S5]-alanine N-acetyltransferase
MADLKDWQAVVNKEYLLLCDCLGLRAAEVDAGLTLRSNKACCGHQREEAGYVGASGNHPKGLIVIPIDAADLHKEPMPSFVSPPVTAKRKNKTNWPDWRVSLYHEVCHQVQEDILGERNPGDGYGGHKVNWWAAVAWVGDRLGLPREPFGTLTLPPFDFMKGRLGAPKPADSFFSPCKVSPIATERLVIREFAVADTAEAHVFLSDPAVMHDKDAAVSSIEESGEYIGKLVKYQENWQRWSYDLAIVLKGEVIGQCGIQIATPPEDKWVFNADTPVWGGTRQPLGNIYYRLAQAHWKKGYATEAARAILRLGFVDLALGEIFADPRDDHPDSTKVLRNLGLHHRPPKAGAMAVYQDVDGTKRHYYSMFPSEWFPAEQERTERSSLWRTLLGLPGRLCRRLWRAQNRSEGRGSTRT